MLTRIFNARTIAAVIGLALIAAGYMQLTNHALPLVGKTINSALWTVGVYMNLGWGSMFAGLLAGAIGLIVAVLAISLPSRYR